VQNLHKTALQYSFNNLQNLHHTRNYAEFDLDLTQSSCPSVLNAKLKFDRPLGTSCEWHLAKMPKCSRLAVA